MMISAKKCTFVPEMRIGYTIRDLKSAGYTLTDVDPGNIIFIQPFREGEAKTFDRGTFSILI